MSVIDTLEILIEADRSGLETQLKAAGIKINEFVDKMNGQEVNWTQILSKSISPAIIAGVAASFAAMISQMVSFQNATATATAGATDSFSSVGGALSSSGVQLEDLSLATRQTQADLEAAGGAVDRAFGGTETADMLKSITIAAAQLATEGIGGVVSNAQLLSETLSSWGIKTGPDAVKALDGLQTAAKNGKMNILDLATTMKEEGPKMAGSVDFTDAVVSLNKWTTVAGQTVETAKTSFGAIGTAIQDQVIGKVNIMNMTVGKMGDIVKNSGVEGAFGALATYITNNPTASVNGLGQQMGLTAISMKADMTSVVSGGIDPFIAKVSLLKTNLETVQSVFNTFLDTAPWAGFINIVGTLMEKLVSGIIDMSPALKAIEDTLTGIFAIKPDAGIAAQTSQLNDQLNTAINAKLSSSGMGFSSSQMSAIENKAQSADMLPQLLHALSGGIQGKGNVSSFYNTFNMTVPAGAESMASENVAKSLYNQFQGIK